MNKSFIICGFIIIGLAIGIIGYTEFAANETIALDKNLTTSLVLKNDVLDKNTEGNDNLKQHQTDQVDIARDKQVFGQDISTPVADMSLETLRYEIKSLERAVEDYDLINRLNNGLATEEDREQASLLFSRLTELRKSELTILMSDFEQQMAQYEEEHKARLEKYKNSPLGVDEDI
ncbi:hypothetical protein [Zooshikella sp. RANM57]|uniref:hypothetical protein n=1 Tax=Zooshikella sp. RANM57 TaxID=3425863 RepID=UPI003D6F4513